MFAAGAGHHDARVRGIAYMPIITMARSHTGWPRRRFVALLAAVAIAAATVTMAAATTASAAATGSGAPSAVAGISQSNGSRAGGNQLAVSQGWQPWFSIAGTTVSPGTTVTAVWRSNDTHVNLFATGSDGTVWSTWWEANRGWQPWFSIAGTRVSPGATVTAVWRSNDTH